MAWLPSTPTNKGKSDSSPLCVKINLSKGRIVYAGFSNGLLRVLLLQKNDFTLLKTIKVHEKAIAFIKVSPNGKVVAVATEDASIFLLQIDPERVQRLTPFCLIEFKVKMNDLSWSDSSDKLLLATQTGHVIEFVVPSIDDCDTSQTYLKDLAEIQSRTYKIMMMEFQKPQIDEFLEYQLRKNPEKLKEKKEVEWDPAPIFAARYMNRAATQFVCSVDGDFLG